MIKIKSPKTLSMNSKNDAVLLVYGAGGHSAQMNSFANKIVNHIEGKSIISLSDVNVKPSWSIKHFETVEFRSKYSFREFLFSNSFFKIMKSIFLIKKKYTVSVVVSTGPGIALIAAVFFKLLGSKIIHIETWSRFETKSLTGSFMCFVADKFYVQHKSLLKYYPNAIYSGLL